MNATLNPVMSPELAYLTLRTALGQYQKSPADLAENQLAEVTKQAHRQFQLESRILSAPEACGIVIASTQLDAALAEVRERYEDQDSFVQDLAKNGMSVEGFEQALRRELHVDAVLERVGARSATINDLEVRIYYHMHPEKFQQPETRTVRHILITLNPEFPENTKEAAQQRLKLIAKRLDNKPKRFAEQAGKHSECPSALQGGLLGRVPKGTLYPELDAVLFTLAENQISEVIESPIGFHILWCESIHAAGLMSYKDAQPKILELLQKRRRRICQKSWISQLPAQSDL
ncbi:MAG: nitrogen fixation protein NifM [Pseudomonadota bacterium]|jgi:nitrogen fixation protein NifM